MSLVDAFTPDGKVEMKHDEYYTLMREAAKAEIISNATKAKVPTVYINAMLTGEEITIEKVLEEETALTDFSVEYKQITGAVCSIFDAWEKINGVEVATKALHRLIDTLASARMDELKVIEENRKEQEAELKAKADRFTEIIKKTWERMPAATDATPTQETETKPEEEAPAESEDEANGND